MQEMTEKASGRRSRSQEAHDGVQAPEGLEDRLAGLLPPDALQDALRGLAPEEITGAPPRERRQGDERRPGTDS
jgi:hypothetical protein